MISVRHTLGLAGLLAAALALAACQRTQLASPLITDYDEADATAELDYWHGLADRPLTTNNDAMHGLIEFHRGEDPTRSYEERLQLLKDEGLLDPGFDRPADEAVTRGTVAQVLSRSIGIEGGLTMRLIGAHPRYATRELVYLDIMRRGTAQQGMAGIEFVGTVARAEAYEGRLR